MEQRKKVEIEYYDKKAEDWLGEASEEKWQSDFEGFLGAKRLWEWENEFWLRKIGYL